MNKSYFFNLKSKQKIIILVLIFTFFFSLITGFWNGSYDLEIIKFFKNELDNIQQFVLKKIRFPRVILAAFVGSSLALSGACLQGLFRNPLADPGLIGVSSGAALGAAFSIVLGSEIIVGGYLKTFLLPLSAILGSVVVIVLLSIITKGFKNSNITYIILAGIAINSLAGVGIGFLTYISDDAELRGLSFWSMGSFEGISWNLIIPSIIMILITTLWTLTFARKLDIIQLGENDAHRLGVNIRKLKINIIISSSIIVGVSTSLVGMIGFVGLVVPHLVRLLGGSNHNYLLIASILFGSSLMIIADLISRTIIQPAQLPVGLITSAIGAPFFLWLIYKMKRK